MGQIHERNDVRKESFAWLAGGSGSISLAALFWGLWSGRVWRERGRKVKHCPHLTEDKKQANLSRSRRQRLFSQDTLHRELAPVGL